MKIGIASFLIILPFTLFSQDRSLISLAEEALLQGRLKDSSHYYLMASQENEGRVGQQYQIYSLLIRYEIGDFSGLREEAAFLAASGMTSYIKREALILEIKIWGKFGYMTQAMSLIDHYDNIFERDIRWLWELSRFYRSAGLEEEALRKEWMLKKYFPDSPESMALSGESRIITTPEELLSPRFR